MMETDRELSLRAELVNEILDDIKDIHGSELDEYLAEIGFDPADLLRSFESSLASYETKAKRRRFDAAREHVAISRGRPPATLLAFELSRKREVFAVVTAHIKTTGEMTLAARNQKIEAEEDLDSFLDACFRLGMIDENGNLKG
jgi:hypothetical protein